MYYKQMMSLNISNFLFSNSVGILFLIPVSQMYTGTSILLIALYGYGTFNVLVALVFEVTVLE